MEATSGRVRELGASLTLARKSVRLPDRAGVNARRPLHYGCAGFSGDITVDGAIDETAGAALLASAVFTDAGTLSAFFTSTLTCQIWVSFSWPLNPGMPVKIGRASCR